MRRFISNSVLPRLLLLLILLSILGVSPRFHQVEVEMREAGKAISSGSFLKTSLHIANAARYLPWRSDLWELAGHYALQAGDSQAATRYLERAAQTDAEAGFPFRSGLSPRGQIDLGDAYEKSGDLSAAIHSWQTALSHTGPSSELVERLAQAYVFLGNYPNARAVLQTLTPINPDDAQLYYRLGLFTATQNPEEALDFLEKAAEIDSSLGIQVSKIRREILSARITEDLAYSLVSAGRALASLGNWGLAAEAFRQATLARPDYAEAWAYLGEALQHLADQSAPVDTSNHLLIPNSTNLDDGLPELQKALELNPKSLATHIFMGFYWKRQMRYDQALKHIRLAVSLDNKNPALLVELASLLAASGDLSGAYKAYRRAASLSPHEPTYLRYIVEFSLQYDYQIEEIALPVARRLIIQYPEEPANLDLMAQALIQQSDLANARRFLDRALLIDVNYAPAHLHLGVVYILEENWEAAYQEFDLAASLAPESNVADQARRLLETYFP